jgi:type I restriction enzyme S subunit
MVSLGEIAEFRNGVNFIATDRGEGIPVLNVKDFQDRTQPDYAGLEELKSTAVRDQAFIREGDTLFVRSNGNKELIGRSMHIRTAPPRPTTHSAFTIRMRIMSAAADPLYCAYYVRGGPVRRMLSVQGSGTNISNLNQDILNRLQIWLPKIDVQRRIACILSTYDDLIEVNTRRVAILEEMARRLFDEWFIKFRYPGHHSVPMVVRPTGPVPTGWQLKTVGEAWEVIGGGTPSKARPEYWDGGTINWYTPSDLTGADTSFMERSSNRITQKGLAESSARLFPARSVMMTSRATLGVIAINAEEATTNQGFITCIPNDNVPLPFLYHWLKANTDEFERHASGATFKEITKGVFKKLPVVLPPKALTAKFTTIASPWLELSHTLQKAAQNLRSARDYLLPKLISGEIDLNKAEAKLEAAQ